MWIGDVFSSENKTPRHPHTLDIMAEFHRTSSHSSQGPLRVYSPATISSDPLWGYPDALRWRGSVIPSILPSILATLLGATLVCTLHLHYGYQLNLPSTIVSSFSVVLGLLLVFRTNTSYDRYWEGRKLWGALLAQSRHVARIIWLCLPNTAVSLSEKKRALDWIVALCVATKHWLREEHGTHYADMYDWVPPRMTTVFASKTQDSPALYENTAFTVALEDAQHGDSPVSLPQEILVYLALYATRLSTHNADHGQCGTILASLANITQILADMNRVSTTPIPLAYRIHMKQAVMLYCLTLPFTLLDLMGWGTIPVVGAVAFTLFGIDRIGAEIEQPFGFDPNDLDLDEFCQVVRRYCLWLRRDVPPGGDVIPEDVWSNLMLHNTS